MAAQHHCSTCIGQASLKLHARMVEQPGSSLMAKAERVVKFSACAEKAGLQYDMCRFWMGNFQHFAPKPSYLLGVWWIA